jgi:hypothetical protein
VGLNYAGVAEVGRALGIPLEEQTLRLLQRVECARLQFVAEEAKKKEAPAR